VVVVPETNPLSLKLETLSTIQVETLWTLLKTSVVNRLSGRVRRLARTSVETFGWVRLVRHVVLALLKQQQTTSQVQVQVGAWTLQQSRPRAALQSPLSAI
jgi:uncharacterized membrane protein